MTITVAVAGATGYAGSEILRLLLAHPAYLRGELRIGALTANSSAGQSVAELMPHVVPLNDRVIEETTAENLAGHDVVFLGLPHGFSAEIARQVGQESIVIDCAADFRLRDPEAWRRYYASEHAGSWPYGIPEMPGHREQLRGARRIAVPGCFPTGATLALMPAVAAGLIEKDIAITSITGVSGAGKKASVPLLGSETMGSLKAYNTAGKHRHTPEIIQNLSELSDGEITLSFTPVLAPLPRGILTTATARVNAGVSAEDARAAYEEFYASEPFVQLLPAGVQPQTQNVVGANSCHVQVELDELSGRLLLSSAIDNLTKGTAGAAVQCMNLALGWEETLGLPLVGVAP
ncbi:N-acetyl-gamma-glutamyl-phosphate reductase [Corynebacterium ciconiae DSM 44920]|uniref:N-acetyl-gamma-glutamyl-phosphate reductase n=1 Tax=Corynebacterium ciconiae TaxID=227319 RepID=UPI0003806731|nr:N-acetyl-gamma-glutamyl-phosphate reductase [Corynebacterium ciconiae]WKD61101.1 N-acetyl-gamma-glutamyl-phosphate reductase [Corynebacterium ciconiae DSM 44920]